MWAVTNKWNKSRGLTIQYIFENIINPYYEYSLQFIVLIPPNQPERWKIRFFFPVYNVNHEVVDGDLCSVTAAALLISAASLIK